MTLGSCEYFHIKLCCTVLHSLKTEMQTRPVLTSLRPFALVNSLVNEPPEHCLSMTRVISILVCLERKIISTFIFSPVLLFLIKAIWVVALRATRGQELLVVALAYLFYYTIVNKRGG